MVATHRKQRVGSSRNRNYFRGVPGHPLPFKIYGVFAPDRSYTDPDHQCDNRTV